MDTKGLIGLTVRLIRAGKRAYTKKWSFFALSVCVFFGSVLVLGQLDLLPNAPSMSATSSVAVTVSASPLIAANTIAPAPVAISELPTKIEIPAISITATVANPSKTDIEVLDRELLKGAVRYPTSAKLGETGNVVLFGHSSYLPIVGNQAFKAFNGIQKLVVGDTVTVSSLGTAYTYKVRSVAKEKANDNSAIPLSAVGKTLTLVTCNSFGAKEDRFVVTADFVESHSISI